MVRNREVDLIEMRKESMERGPGEGSVEEKVKMIKMRQIDRLDRPTNTNSSR